ncbi:MAG: peptide/nickel transport system substrate-binding protein [Gaiellaceae bacterium]|jgi:peptide/nickel transport system substrate-binding protein|nr:peptide/nickel transport system substrate-binding protein [Gaiellaceae bacterium]MDX6471559.1 peptide/nickel transport system substrate-binding protein [Gaiellaceae bacterium]
MDHEKMMRLEEFRRLEAGPLEGTLIDEFVDGEMDRSTFIRRASVLGLSMSMIGAALEAFGHTGIAKAAPAVASAGGRLRLGVVPPPVTGLDPHTYKDTGGLVTGGIAGEFLTRATQSLTLLPELALSWKPNGDASVWTFKLRSGVKFQSGQAFGADDVVATYDRLTASDTGSQALSAFKGVLSPGGTKAIDNLTVEFHLDAPTANFPYLTSSTTYQGILLPANYKLGTFEKTPQTTGAFKLTAYNPGVSAKYERNPGWWGGTAPLDGVDVTYYSDDSAIIAALLSGQIDLINQINFVTGRALFTSPNVQIFNARGATHRQVCMRVDAKNPLKDYRVRQAIALSLDRKAIVKTLFNNYADVGNDSNFAPIYPSTDKAVPQRHKDITAAKKLMAKAGHPKGFKITLTTEKTGEIPQLAQIIQRSVKALGIDMSLNIETATAYFAGTQDGPPLGWGNTPWLNAPMNITDWGHRAVPNVVLTAAFKTKGIWNAAHYSNAKFDQALESFLAAVALKDQQKYEKQMQQILLHDTPVIVPYFYNFLAAGSKKVTGYKADAQGTVFLSHASLA